MKITFARVWQLESVTTNNGLYQSQFLCRHVHLNNGTLDTIFNVFLLHWVLSTQSYVLNRQKQTHFGFFQYSKVQIEQVEQDSATKTLMERLKMILNATIHNAFYHSQFHRWLQYWSKYPLTVLIEVKEPLSSSSFKKKNTLLIAPMTFLEMLLNVLLFFFFIKKLKSISTCTLKCRYMWQMDVHK